MKNLKDIIEGQNFLVNRKLAHRQTAIEYFPADKIDLENIIIDLLNNGITNFNCIDVSKIDDMSDLFYIIKNHIDDNKITKIDVSDWDVSNVTDMSKMFCGLRYIEKLDLSRWDVSNVTSMHTMFGGCFELKELNIENWDTKNVKWINNLFYNCHELDCDLSNWNMSSWNRLTDDTFYGCDTIRQKHLIPKWYKK